MSGDDAPRHVAPAMRVRSCAACRACDYTAAWGRLVPVPDDDWRCRGCGETDWRLVGAPLPTVASSRRPPGCPEAPCPYAAAAGCPGPGWEALSSGGELNTRSREPHQEPARKSAHRVGRNLAGTTIGRRPGRPTRFEAFWRDGPRAETEERPRD